jgi:tetratricopeptide (TPR) repeat protein/ferredoxin
MPTSTATKHCTPSPGASNHGGIALPVLPSHPARIRKSKNGPRRAAVLIGVHLLIIGHLIHWWITGRTISPVEPSEAMYTLNQGYLNAGFIFFALAILSTLILGRFLCGWGCHLVAYQDFCGWLMKKIGVRPKPFRSRLLVLAPLALAIYMFVWPTAYRWFVGAPAPALSNHLTTAQFWKTFPGLIIAVISLVVCGFAIVYVLGAKGFCTYACPYGGFFAVADKVAPGRIFVTNDCEQCGHCTAVCTSNVRVHEEVARFGMVVDPGCMKCMDCVSVCPNEALYFGFGQPPMLAQSSKFKVQSSKSGPLPDDLASDSSNRQSQIANRKSGSRYDFTLGEEVAMAVVGLAALLAYRGLYGQIPLLLAMGMAAIASFLFIKFTHLLRHANLKIQNKQLQRGGSITRVGWVFATAAVIVFAFTAHSFAVQYEFWQGRRAFATAGVGDDVWLPGATWWHQASEDQRGAVQRAIRYFERGQKISLMNTPAALQDQVWLYLAKGDLAAAESAARTLLHVIPDQAEPHRGLAGILRLSNRPHEAEQSYRRALELDRSHDAARGELTGLLISERRFDDAFVVLRDGETASQDAPRWRVQSAIMLAQIGLAELQENQMESGVRYLRQALELNPELTQVRYNLGVALLSVSKVPEAIEHLHRVVTEKPEMAEAHYNLAVGVFMSGRPAEAIPHAREALRLAPDDRQTQQFLAMLEREIRPLG